MIVHKSEMGDPLYMLAEECAEVIQAIMKYRRFAGRASPLADGAGDESLRQGIIQEIADVLAVIEMLRGGAGDVPISQSDIDQATERKALKLRAIFGDDE